MADSDAPATARSRDVAWLLVAQHPELRSNPMKVNALLYLSQSWSLAITGRPLFAEDILAAADGPYVTGVFPPPDQNDRTPKRAPDSRAPNPQSLTRAPVPSHAALAGQLSRRPRA